MKSGNLNFLEPSGPLQACKGTVLPFHLHKFLFINKDFDVLFIAGKVLVIIIVSSSSSSGSSS